MSNTKCSPVFTVEEAMADGASSGAQLGRRICRRRSRGLDEYNKSADPRDGKVIYQFPAPRDVRRNIASAAHGEIGSVEKGFKEADLVIERTYQTNQIQCTPVTARLLRQD